LQVRQPEFLRSGRKFEFIATVEAPGIEADSGQAENTIAHELGSIGDQRGPTNEPDGTPKCTIVGSDVTESSKAYELSNVVETALVRALVLAAEAQRWDVVVLIAAELQARRDKGALLVASPLVGWSRGSRCV
jgi:hypothetical protein